MFGLWGSARATSAALGAAWGDAPGGEASAKLVKSCACWIGLNARLGLPGSLVDNLQRMVGVLEVCGSNLAWDGSVSNGSHPGREAVPKVVLASLCPVPRYQFGFGGGETP